MISTKTTQPRIVYVALAFANTKTPLFTGSLGDGVAVALLRLWSRGELNPGPVTVPSVFYVRSLLAVRQFFCPHVIADNSWRAYLQ